MKVLELLGENISRGGEEAFLVNLLEHMERSDMEIHVMTPYVCKNHHYRQRIEALGGKVFALGLSYQPGGLRTNIIRPLFLFLKENRYDVVHVHSGSISVLTFAAAISRLCGAPNVIVHSHSSGQTKSFSYRLIKMISIPVLAVCANAYCACSREAGEWKFSRRVVHHQMKIIPNGIDLERYAFDPEKRHLMRRHLELGESTLLVGHVGRFAPEKNHAFLLRVFAEILSQKPNSRLILIGSGELDEPIQEQAAALGLTDRIFFQGNVDNVSDYLQAMDVFVFPSFHEGLPLVCVEAQAAGLPCVISESVPKQIKLISSTLFVSLEQSVSHWAQVILQAAKKSHTCETESLRTQGYDIDATAADVRKLYQ